MILRPLTKLGLIGVALCGLGCSGAIPGDHKPSNGQGGGSDPGNPSDPSKPGNGGSNPGNGGGSNPGNGGTTMNPVPPAGLPSDSATVPGTAPLRRLTKLEYVNTVRDLLGFDAIPPARLAAFSADQESGGSGFVRGGSVTAAPDARVFLQTSEDLAAAVVPKLAGMLPCNPMPTAAAEQDDCADKFLAGFARRAYRRPLQDQELSDLKELYRAQRAPAIGSSFEKAIASTIGALLQSPYFLYRWELGPAAATRDGNLVRFNHHEVASRLSYLFWASMPDDKLFTAADNGKLGTPDEVANEARRMLSDPRARVALNDFHVQWLRIGDLGDLPKDPSITDYSPEVAKSMLKETEEFIANVFQGPKADGKLETLLTSPASYIDGNLAKIYGLKNVTGANMQPVSFDPAQRAGLLTQGTFLTAKADAIDSHPIKRGDTVLESLLCMSLEVPANITVPPLPEPKPGQTTRERVSVHSMAPCATCHLLIDPVGFSFENYDAIGRYRTMEENKPVDASGSFSIGKDTIKFKNAVELLPAMAKSQEVRDCMATQWWRYALRRQELQSEDPSLKLVREAFRQSGNDLRELLVAFTRTRAFSHRQPSADEVLQ
jgi:hypothetical protein